MSRRISIDHHREIAIYAVLTFVAMLSLTLMAPVIPEFIINRFNASNTEASMFFTLEMLAYVIFAVVWGSLSDKRGKRKTFIVFGFGGSAVLYFLMAQASSLHFLLGRRFIQGAITVMAWSLVMTSALDCVQRTSNGKTMGAIGIPDTMVESIKVLSEERKLPIPYFQCEHLLSGLRRAEYLTGRGKMRNTWVKNKEEQTPLLEDG